LGRRGPYVRVTRGLKLNDPRTGEPYDFKTCPEVDAAACCGKTAFSVHGSRPKTRIQFAKTGSEHTHKKFNVDA
jgi:hypothetical protein